MMATWTLYDSENERAVLYDSTTERPFGPGFHSQEEAECFLRFVVAHGQAPTRLTASALDLLHDEWCGRTRCSACGREVDFDRLAEATLLHDEEFLAAVGKVEGEDVDYSSFTCATMAATPDGYRVVRRQEIAWVNAIRRPRCPSLQLEVVRA